MSETTIYRALSPVPVKTEVKLPLASCLPDLSGKTFAAFRHTFRADETFPMIETLLKEKYENITFISNLDNPDVRPATPEEEAEFAALLKKKKVDVVLAGNGA